MRRVCSLHLIHAVDPNMRQERPQIGVRQDAILGNPGQDLRGKVCSEFSFTS